MVDIRKFVDEYKLRFGGVEFWVPYPYAELTLAQRREYADKEPITPPYKGRGTPQEIGGYLSRELQKAKERPVSSEKYRRFMAELSLGVDCSGFSYYVLDELLKVKLGAELKHHLHKSRRQLLEIYNHPKLTPPADLARDTVANYPDWVSLAQIEADWGNNPRYVVNSTTFTNEGSTIEVDIENVQTADIIGMMGYDGIGHHLVVISVDAGKIVYAHSAGRHGGRNGYGGVEYGEIKLTDPSLPLKKQDWSDRLILTTHKFATRPIRRLKVLAENGQTN